MFFQSTAQKKSTLPSGNFCGCYEDVAGGRLLKITPRRIINPEKKVDTIINDLELYDSGIILKMNGDPHKGDFQYKYDENDVADLSSIHTDYKRAQPGYENVREGFETDGSNVVSHFEKYTLLTKLTEIYYDYNKGGFKDDIPLTKINWKKVDEGRCKLFNP